MAFSCLNCVERDKIHCFFLYSNHSQYYCGEGSIDTIVRVEEPATCEYIITVHSVKLCDHPAFHIEEKTKKVNLICSPALSEKAYSKYVEKKNALEIEKREKEGLFIIFFIQY